MTVEVRDIDDDLGGTIIYMQENLYLDMYENRRLNITIEKIGYILSLLTLSSLYYRSSPRYREDGPLAAANSLCILGI